MKISAIKVGMFYFDGKAGLREVTAINGSTVSYSVRAAKAERQWNYKKQDMESVIGKTSKMELQNFAIWAKQELAPNDVDALLVTLAAKKLKLTPGELEYMSTIAKEIDGIPTAGTSFSFEAHEKRAAASLAKKGVVTNDTGESTLTPLGAAYLQHHLTLQAA